MPALTAYPTGTASASTLTTADTMLASAPASETSHTTKTGKLLAWGELFSQGSAATWPAGGAAPSPSGHGFIYDVTTAGNMFFKSDFTGVALNTGDSIQFTFQVVF